VSQTVRDLPYDVGCSRCNHKQIGMVCQVDVVYHRWILFIKGVDSDMVAGKRLKCQRGDKAGGRLGHNHSHIRPALCPLADQSCRFVSGDSSGHTEDDSLSFQFSPSFPTKNNNPSGCYFFGPTSSGGTRWPSAISSRAIPTFLLERGSRWGVAPF